ncbi:MAG: ArsI/CadI family heavy metal resistance metalloenzyme [Pseudomonadota bacterium]
MKRLHVHLKVEDLGQSVRYYAALFGRAPDKLEIDYAKWMLDDPYANVALSTHGGAPGVDHVGVQVEDAGALGAIATRLADAGAPLMQEDDTTCCYAQSDKFWSRDPQGAVWELFHTTGESETYGAEPDRAASCGGGVCCVPGAPRA